MAAERFTRYFDCKLELFGEEKLACDITLEDCTVVEDEQQQQQQPHHQEEGDYEKSDNVDYNMQLHYIVHNVW